MKVAAIDFETANPQRNSACSIGIAIADDDGSITCHHFYIRPEPCYFGGIQMGIHGITPNDVANAPTLPELWPQIWPLIDGALVIAHNAPFDMSVLRASLAGQGGDFSFSYIDTCAMAKDMLPMLSNHKLNNLCDYFNIELDHHRADSDARATLELFFRLSKFEDYTSLEKIVKTYSDYIYIYDSTQPNNHKKPDAYRIYHNDTPANWNEIRKYKPAYPLPGIAGKSFCVTGKCLTFERQHLLELISLFGGVPCENVSPFTDFLIIGNTTTKSKWADQHKAEDLQSAGGHIQIINEDDFWKMIPTDTETILSYKDSSIKWSSDDSVSRASSYECPSCHRDHISVKELNAIDTVYEDDDFMGKSFCLTGELSMPRKKAMEIISKLGGLVTTTVTKKTDYVLIGSDVDYNGSKMKKALAAIEAGQEIRIIDELEFIRMIDDEAGIDIC